MSERKTAAAAAKPRAASSKKKKAAAALDESGVPVGGGVGSLVVEKKAKATAGKKRKSKASTESEEEEEYDDEEGEKGGGKKQKAKKARGASSVDAHKGNLNPQEQRHEEYMELKASQHRSCGTPPTLRWMRLTCWLPVCLSVCSAVGRRTQADPQLEPHQHAKTSKQRCTRMAMRLRRGSQTLTAAAAAALLLVQCSSGCSHVELCQVMGAPATLCTRCGKGKLKPKLKKTEFGVVQVKKGVTKWTCPGYFDGSSQSLCSQLLWLRASCTTADSPLLHWLD
jgi:hypothetical protein